MSAYVPCPRDCHERCLYNTAASGCPFSHDVARQLRT